jgi:hypothetical protein
MDAIKDNSEILLEVIRVIDLEINAEKTKYMIMSRHPNSGQKKVEKFKYLGTTLTNQNDIRDEVKSRLNSRNACYY